MWWIFMFCTMWWGGKPKQRKRPLVSKSQIQDQQIRTTQWARRDKLSHAGLTEVASLCCFEHFGGHNKYRMGDSGGMEGKGGEGGRRASAAVTWQTEEYLWLDNKALFNFPLWWEVTQTDPRAAGFSMTRFREKKRWNLSIQWRTAPSSGSHSCVHRKTKTETMTFLIVSPCRTVGQ